MSQMKSLNHFYDGAELAQPQSPFGFKAVAGFVSHFATKAIIAFRNREAVRTLARLDDRMLQDMGLTRGDVIDALSEPITRDPTVKLAGRRVSRAVKLDA